jgi:hypothetical protein
MSKEQILELYPNAYTPSKPGEYKDNLKEFLKIDNFKVVNENFSVIFIGKNNTVTWVKLSLSKGYTTRECEVIFDTLTHALNSRYGELKSTKSDKYGKQNYWTSQNLSISLVFMPIIQLVDVNYEYIPYSSNEKL